jgi:hypothetical protein
MKKVMLLLSFLLAAIPAAFALDPGTAKGSLKVGGKDVPLKVSIAYVHDNAEGMLDRPRELRIALIDREIPQDALSGIGIPPVMQIAREGKVRGVLLRLDPGNLKEILVTLLDKPADPRMSLMTQTISDSSLDAFRKLTVANNRAIGEIERRDSRSSASADMPTVDFAVQFNAPVFSEPPVTADLKGKAAQDSPQVRLMREKARILAKGDFAALKKISTERANKSTDAFLAQAGAQAKPYAKQAAAEIEQSIKNVQRVVVRGDRAVVIFGKGEWTTFARESGEWRSDE